MKEFLKRNKRIAILLCIVVLILFTLIMPIGKTLKNIKANVIYGLDKCPYNGSSLHGSSIMNMPMSATVMTSYVCKICGLPKQNGDSDIPSMCPKCQEITNRCKECGKKISKK